MIRRKICNSSKDFDTSEDKVVSIKYDNDEDPISTQSALLLLAFHQLFGKEIKDHIIKNKK